jgi:ABC-type lipoprotein release transport system permease subunit
MVFGVTTRDPFAFVTVIAVTLVAVAAASYLPARRATKVAPVIAMRAD